MTSANQSITTLESVLDLAIELERTGTTFYQQARATTADAQLDELFAWLSGEEKKHEAVYRQYYERFTGQTAETTELLGEYGHFIHLMRREISLHLQMPDKPSIMALLDMALRFEKDTLLYFHEITALFPDCDRAPIVAICNEERRHIRALLALRKENEK